MAAKEVMRPPEPDTEQLLDLAGRGDRSARNRLLDRHRERLRALIALHMDRRPAAQELGISRMTLYKKLHKYGLFPAT